MRQKLVTIARFTQGLCGHGAHLCTLEAGQTLTKAGQAVPAPLHGLGGQVARFVEAIALANGFLQVLRAVVLAMVNTADFKAKTVRPQIDSRHTCSVLHQWSILIASAQHSIRVCLA